MTSLDRRPRLADAGQFYADLLAVYDGLPPAGRALVSARLILLLANHIGDMDVLRQAFALARDPDRPLPGRPAAAVPA